MGPQALAPLAFVGILALAGAALLLWSSRRARVRDVLVRRLGARRVQDALVRNEADGFTRWMAQAGLGWTVGQLAGRLGAAAALGLVLGLVLGSGALAVLLAPCGCVAMWVVVSRTRTARLAKCDALMPQALEIIALALRAGQALPGALALAAEEVPAPLCHELRHAHEEHQLGRSISEVLAAMGARLPGCAAIETFVVAVAVLQETGGNLISVIDRIVDNARSRAGYQTRFRALTAEGRQSARLLALIPGVFFLLAVASDKSYATLLLHDSGGRMILMVTVALWMTGLLWTRRLVRPLA